MSSPVGRLGIGASWGSKKLSGPGGDAGLPPPGTHVDTVSCTRSTYKKSILCRNADTFGTFSGHAKAEKTVAPGSEDGEAAQGGHRHG
jgi:hypothetical protein